MRRERQSRLMCWIILWLNKCVLWCCFAQGLGRRNVFSVPETFCSRSGNVFLRALKDITLGRRPDCHSESVESRCYLKSKQYFTLHAEAPWIYTTYWHRYMNERRLAEVHLLPHSDVLLTKYLCPNWSFKYIAEVVTSKLSQVHQGDRGIFILHFTPLNPSLTPCRIGHLSCSNTCRGLWFSKVSCKWHPKQYEFTARKQLL